MASVRVRLDDYVAGAMPDVSVMSGVPTSHRVRLTDEVGYEMLGAGRVVPLLLYRLEQLRRPGTPRTVLKGRVPMDAAEAARWHRMHGGWRAGRWLATLVLVAAAWSAAPLAPAVAVAALAGIAVTTAGLVRVRRRWPHARIDPYRKWVTLGPVHQAFADAVTGTAGCAEEGGGRGVAGGGHEP